MYLLLTNFYVILVIFTETGSEESRACCGLTRVGGDASEIPAAELLPEHVRHTNICIKNVHFEDKLSYEM